MQKRNDLLKSLCWRRGAVPHRRPGQKVAPANRCHRTIDTSIAFYCPTDVPHSPYYAQRDLFVHVFILFFQFFCSADDVRDMNGHTDEEIKRQRLHYSSDQLYSVS